MLLCLPLANLLATELSPWYGRSFELVARASYEAQLFGKVATGEGTEDYWQHDQIAGFSLGATIFDFASLETEFILSNMKTGHFDLQQFQITGRYLLFSDTQGDFSSVSLGCRFVLPYRPDLHNIGMLDHGQFELEPHIALGIETPCENIWYERHWALFGINIGNEGSPWIRALINWEKNLCDVQQIRIYTQFLAGLGNQNLSLDRPFEGYSKIGFRALDVGVKYYLNLSTVWLIGGEVEVGYTFRAYAKNFPKNVSLIKAEWIYPFGI